jgi:hypothetical protein
MITSRPARQNRRLEDRCAMNRFWNRWGPHLDLSGGIACLTMLAAIIVYIVNFANQSTANAQDITTLQKEQIALHRDLKLATARTDRSSQNIELIMRSLHIKPLPKTDSELQLEKDTSQ